jgi:hypothetical protein
MRQGDYEEAARLLQPAREIDSKTVQTLWPNLARIESERVNAERPNEAAIQQPLQAQEQVLQNSISTSADLAFQGWLGWCRRWAIGRPEKERAVLTACSSLI